MTAGPGSVARSLLASPRPNRRTPARSAPVPRPGWAGAALVVAGVGLGATTALTITAETTGQLTATGGLATFAGNLTGMVGTYLALMMVLLVSRLPLTERVLGQDGLLRWHRRLAPWPISLLIAHAVLIDIGYAQAARNGVWHEAGTLLNSYPDVLIATIGLALIGLVGVISIRAIRRRVRREVWWTVHLWLYLALALSFAHVVVLGPSFVGHPLTQLVWSVAWAGTAGLVLVYRFGLPVLRSVRHRLRVAEVWPEGPGVVSVICRGEHLDRLPVSGGQFLFWRFLTRGMWWQAHPYTVSALPAPPYLRLTVKGVGDHSSALARLKPGTPVAIEGPYGVFTRHAQRRPRVLLIAAGIGVTSVRALLEDLPRGAKPVVVLRAARREDLVLEPEIAGLVKRRGGQLHELTGSRAQAVIDQHSLRRVVPDLSERDVYVCGPEGFVTEIVALVRWLGVPDEAIHHEAYALLGQHCEGNTVSALTKRAPLLVLAGAVAGFIGVLSFHTRPATLTLPAGGTTPSPSRTPAATATAGNRGVAGPGAVRSATGAAEQFGYGVLDVKVTVSGIRITDVSVPTLQVAEFTSQQICDQAIPLLRSEVLTAQSARIDGVSGATYTSEAYAASLQAALDALHAK